jgi:AbrB family looped-hinge helix DNA binding protein
MPAPTTVMSTKGQVILPKPVREARKWGPGTRLEVIETPEGVLLKAAPLFPPKTIDEVFGSVKYDGPPVSIEEMDRGIEDMIRERAERGRY